MLLSPTRNTPLSCPQNAAQNIKEARKHPSRLESLSEDTPCIQRRDGPLPPHPTPPKHRLLCSGRFSEILALWGALSIPCPAKSPEVSG